MPDPRHFEVHAEIYDRGRPPYPEALWSRLSELGLLRAGVRVVELGAGSGQATGPMLRAGAAVTAVEPGPALAARLGQRWPEATVLVETAESVRLPPSAFDLAVIATAVHWFDLDVVLPQLHRALVPDGHLVVWRTVFGDPAAPVTPFRQRVAAITGRRVNEPVRPVPSETDTASWLARLTQSGHFACAHVEEFGWALELGTDEIRNLFTTFSNWSRAEVDEAAEAVDALGGRVVEHYLTPLIVLRRVPDEIPAGGVRGAQLD